MSVKMSEFIAKSIEHKFEVSKLNSFKSDQHYNGDVASIAYNNVTLGFELSITPADSKHKSTNCMGVYLKYVDGPPESISIRFSLHIMGEKEKTCIFGTNGVWMTLTQGDSEPSAAQLTAQIPRRRDDLGDKGYLTQENTILHISAYIYISLDAFDDFETETSPTPIPEVTEEEQLAIAIQESEEEEKERQRQLDLFLKYNGPDVGGDQGLPDTEANENFTDGPDKAESTNSSLRDHKLYPSLNMKENEAKQDVVVGSDAVSPPASTQQTLESHLNSFTQTNQHFALGLREQIDVFINRLMSNQTHGRSIVNDSMIETLFVSLTSQHGALLERMQTLGDKRVHYCWLQERMAEIGELRRALDELRNEEKRKKQIHKQIIIQHKLTQLRTHKHQMLEQRRMLALQRFQHQQIHYGQVPTSNFGVWPQSGLGMHQSQRTPSYNPSHIISQQPMIMQQYSNSHYAYPSPQYLNATAPPQMCPQMPGADQQGNNTNQPNVGLLIDL